MPTGSALVCRLKNIEPIEGADRIVQATMFGETIIITKDYQEGTIGLLFDIETQLSHEFCHYNNLYRHEELNDNKTQSGYIEDNRRVKPIRLKGVRTSGLFMPIESLDWITSDDTTGKSISFTEDYPEEDTQLTEWKGQEICKKWVPSRTQTQGSGKKNKEGRISKKDMVPTFKEHFDTDHFARNIHKIKKGDYVVLTEKLHGTSVRAGYVPAKTAYNFREKVARFVADIIMHFNFRWPKNVYFTDYKFVVGSRRTVKSIEGEELNHNSYYNVDVFTEVMNKKLKGKLEKGEVVYGEIVGYTSTNIPISGRSHSNEKLKSFMDKDEYKEFINKYGKETQFSYGCSTDPDADKLNELYVYRITRQNEDGESIDLSWEQVKNRCGQLGVKHVPEFTKGIMEREGEFRYEDFPKDAPPITLEKIVQIFTEKDSSNFPQHLNEGICVRVENAALTPLVLKSKRYLFRVLEGNVTEQTIEDEN